MKLLIVDDDKQIRTGIKQSIDWKSLDITKVLTASSGVEALEIFEKEPVEIVITDVRMPQMDGLELLEKIKEKMPKTKVIIFSGYDDFKYLQKAIRFGAVDYELKPIRAKKLISLIERVKRDIIKEQITADEYQKYLLSYKEAFGQKLITGTLTDQLIIQEGLQQNYHLNPKGYFVYIDVFIDGSGETTDEEVVDAKKEFENCVAKSEFAHTLVNIGVIDKHIVFLMSAERDSFIKSINLINQLIDFIKSYQRELNKEKRLTFSVGISQPGKIARFNESRRQADEALATRFYYGHGHVQLYDESINLSDEEITDLKEDKSLLVKISELAFGDVLEMVEKTFKRLEEEQAYTKKSVIRYAADLIRIFIYKVESLPEDLIDHLQKEIEMIEKDQETIFFDDVKRLVIGTINQIRQRLAKSLSPTMLRVDSYIYQHYQEAITVGEVAAFVELSPNYFSHVFNREFGVPFNEYVNSLRIKKAKILILETDALIYEISDQVGFSNYRYFTKIYKAIEGYSPTELRHK